MLQLKDTAIVLKRMNYGEADKIITFITKEHGKLRLIAKGVRRSTSKLSGGVELFALSYIQYIPSKNGLGTLTSTRIKENYYQIITNLGDINSAYEMLGVIDSVSEHMNDKIFYELLANGLAQLDKAKHCNLVLGQFYVRLLSETGHTINLNHDINGDNFVENSQYLYKFDSGAFEPVVVGYDSGVVKLLRLMSTLSEDSIQRVSGAEDEIEVALTLLKSMTEYYLNIKVLKF